MYYIDVAIFFFQLPVERTDGIVVVEVSCANFTSKVNAMYCVKVFLLILFLTASSAFNGVAQRKTG